MGIEQLRGAFEDRKSGIVVPSQVEWVTRDVRRAAVLILLSEKNPDVVLTERAATLRMHPRQISFPGGGLESGEDAVAAALREAREEIGVNPGNIKVEGLMPATRIDVSKFDVTAVLATWEGRDDIAAVDPHEVAAVHRVALTDLADPGARFTATLPVGHRGPAFSVEGLFIWGFTAHLLSDVLDLGGWTQPWDHGHEIEVPDLLWKN